jgi:hypothetical protein
MPEMSENKEAVVVLAESIFSATSGFVATLPIPVEIKAPLLTMTTAIAGAIFVYWKKCINVSGK